MTAYFFKESAGKQKRQRRGLHVLSELLGIPSAGGRSDWLRAFLGG
jgi:hypothetical protein